ncbi:paramyosin, long form-like [Ceratitis capitata]|uniref:paramyosin, long form-like n=1 Tax=Ceratitis capitata TaxID=7213 RepID=UPI00032A2FBD|nr:paramyosin, long form-like [Ceratitis capitata]XP_023159312.1 paramyosin, long form-like [Ceratitis capitata]XP_023159313.1 paramyosin, long form-like [Ceratitis capitata]
MSSSQAIRSSKYSYRASSTGPGAADISIEYSADLAALSRLEDKIRLLQDDLEAERELRQRVSTYYTYNYIHIYTIESNRNSAKLN